MWGDKSEVTYLRARVRELELDLAAERAENRRVERHYGDMLLRRAGTYPVPPPQSTEAQKDKPPPRQPDATAIAKAQAYREYGRTSGASAEEIAEAIKQETGWDEADIARAIVAQNGNGSK